MSPNPNRLHAKASSFLRWPSVQGACASELRIYLGYITVPPGRLAEVHSCRDHKGWVSVSCRRTTLTASALIWHWIPPPSCQWGPELQGKLVMPLTLPSPPAHEGRLARSTYYLDLPVLPDLVDLDLLGIGQGVVQGLWGRLLQLTGGRWRAHHGLCREVHMCLRDQPRLSPPLPSPAPTGRKGKPSILDLAAPGYAASRAAAVHTAEISDLWTEMKTRPPPNRDGSQPPTGYK